MLKRIVICGGLVIASVSHADIKAPVSGFYSTVQSHTYSEPTSIDSILHDFRGDIRSGERAFTLNRVEAGVQYRGFSVGVGMRYDYFLRFDEDVARIYHASSHDEVVPEDDVQKIEIEASHIRAKGVVLGWQWQPLESVGVRVNLAQLEADHMVDGYVSGALALTGDDQYSGQVHFNLESSEDLLLEMPVPDPHGRGYAADIAFDWQVNLQWRAGLQVLDAYSRIQWDDVLYSDLVANTATVTFDANGHLHTNPVLSGYQYLADSTQRLPRKYTGNLRYQVSTRHGVYVEQFYVPDYVSLTSVGYEWTVAEQQRLGAYWNVSSRAIGITAEWFWVSMKLAADQVDERDAHALDLEMALQIPLPW